MRIRIALAAAMAATFITSITMSFNTNPAAASAARNQHGLSSSYRLADFHQAVSADSGAASGQPLTTALLTADQRLFEGLGSSAKISTVGTNAPAPTTTTTTTTAPPPPPPPPPPTDATSTDTADWQCIRVHESGDEYNDPARPSGAYGILEMTWQSYGFNGWPYQAAPALQDALALKLYSEYGWQPWSTRTVCGL